MMKFSWRIFFLCLGVYVISLTITGIVVTENTYNRLLYAEVERSLEEEVNLHSTLTLYLLNSKRFAQEKIHIENYSSNLVDMFNTENNYLEVFDENMNLLATNSTKAWFLPRNELEIALQGQRNFILRRDGEQRFLFIADVLQVEDEKLILSFIKDITHIDRQRTEQYLFFLKTGIIGLLFVALISWALSKLVIRPIEELSSAAQNIASGNYKDRVKVTGKDEIGFLAEQFNIMADEVEQRINMLENESLRQQRFIDNLTHELRTPLTSIIGYADLLRKVDYDRELFTKSLNYIYSEGNRMLKLANTLMDVILLREKAFKLKKQPVLPLLNEVKGLLNVKAQEKGIQLQVIGEDLELPLEKDLLKGAIINLVDNAIKASRPGTVITLGVEQVQNKPCIYVADQGKGMDELEVRKVKEPFYRVDKSRSRKEGGLGLGLAICEQIVKVHGAELVIESQVGKGTKVKIIFEITRDFVTHG